MKDDVLENVAGRAWLVAELRFIANVGCVSILREIDEFPYVEPRDKVIYRSRARHVAALAVDVAKKVESGSVHIGEAIEVIANYHRVAHALYEKCKRVGMSKLKKDAATAFGDHWEEHLKWVHAFHEELHALPDAKRPRMEAARRTITGLGLNLNPRSLLRVVRKFPWLPETTEYISSFRLIMDEFRNPMTRARLSTLKVVVPPPIDGPSFVERLRSGDWSSLVGDQDRTDKK